MIRRLIILLLIVVGLAQSDNNSNDNLQIIIGGISSQIIGNLGNKFDLYDQQKNYNSLSIGFQNQFRNNFIIGIGLISKGAYYGENDNILGSNFTKIKLNYAQLKFSLPYKLFDYKLAYSNEIQLNLPIGFSIGYLIKAEYNHKKRSIFSNFQSRSSILDANKFDFGIPIGIELDNGDKLALGIDYYIGLIDIFDDIKSRNRSLEFYMKYKLS